MVIDLKLEDKVNSFSEKLNFHNPEEVQFTSAD